MGPWRLDWPLFHHRPGPSSLTSNGDETSEFPCLWDRWLQRTGFLVRSGDIPQSGQRVVYPSF